MNSKNNRDLIITSFFCLLPILFALIFYSQLPSEMPSHWNFKGEVDGYMAKDLVVFGLPIILLIFNFIVHIAINNNPKEKAVPIVFIKLSKWIIPVLSIILSSLTILVALGYKLPITTIVLSIVGIMFIGIGKYLPKCKQNYVVGIKLPWTLNSEENWNRTHCLAGYLFIIVGVLMIITSLINLKSSNLSGIILIGLIIVVVIIPTIYSLILYKKGI